MPLKLGSDDHLLKGQYLQIPRDRSEVLPDVKVLEGLEGGDGLGDGPDGVVVEQQSLQAFIVCTLPWDFHQLVSGQV